MATRRTSPTPTDEVRAAGGVVWRRRGDVIEVLLVHRPRYDDWSLPKGKCTSREDDLACALREVREETGLECEAGEELPSTEYRDDRGRRKIVRGWTSRPRRGRFEPDDEVDGVRWMTPAEAGSLVTYEHDETVLRALRW